MAKRPSRKEATKRETPRSVDPQSGIKLLRKLIDKANELALRPKLDSSDVEAWKATARDYLVRTFGSESPNVNSVLYASGDGGTWMGMSNDALQKYLRSGMHNKIKMINSCIEQLETEIQLGSYSITSASEDATHAPESNRVFVVHGHNHGIKESVARFIEKLDLKPVILHEKPNAGRTIIEKFSDYSY